MDSLGFYKLHREPLQRIPRPGSVPQRNPPWRSCAFLHTETKAQVEKTPRFPLLKGRWYAVNVKLFISNKTRQQNKKNKKKSLHTTGCVVCHYLYFLPLHVTGTRLHPLCHTLQQYVHFPSHSKWNYNVSFIGSRSHTFIYLFIFFLGADMCWTVTSSA